MACLSSPGASKWAAPRVARPRDALGLGRGQPFYTASASRRYDPDTEPSANATTRTTATTTMSQQPMPPVPIIPPYEHEAPPQPQFLPSQQYHHHHHHHRDQYQQYQQYQPQHREHHQQQYQHHRQQHVAVPVEADPYLVGSREIHPYEHDEVEIQHHHHDYHPYNNSQHAYDTQDHHNHYVVRTPNVKGRHHHSAAATAKMFAPMKSPMSQCIDTIIGAAEIVNRSDEAWVDQRRSLELHVEAEVLDQKNDIVNNSNGNDLADENDDHHNQPAVDCNQIQPLKGHKKNTTKESPSKSPTIMEEVDKIEAALENPHFYRTLTLTMALERPRKTEKPAKLPPSLIGEGFYWKEYPELEDVLYCEMTKYYEYSANSRQSKHQQAYNNALVESVKEVAAEYGYEFDPTVYNDKKLRDRIRCFYKTHLQNAKKRLQTLQKHIVGPEQRRVLLTLIESAKSQPPIMSQVSYSSDEDNDDDEAPVRKRRRRSISE